MTERKLKPTATIKAQTTTLRQGTVIRSSVEAGTIFFTINSNTSSLQQSSLLNHSQ
jgi:hypothetical protein